MHDTIVDMSDLNSGDVQAFKFFCNLQKLIEGKFELLSRLGELIFVCRISFHIPVSEFIVFRLHIMTKGLQDMLKKVCTK